MKKITFLGIDAMDCHTLISMFRDGNYDTNK